MSTIDLILLFILAIFALSGFWFGFIQSLGSIAGFFLGIVIASRTYDIFGGSVLFKIIAFILIFTFVSKIIGLGFYLVDKIIKVIPFSKILNRLSGLILGIIEGFLAILGIVFILNYYHLENWGNFMAGSHIAPFVYHFANILVPFVTAGLAKVQYYF